MEVSKQYSDTDNIGIFLGYGNILFSTQAIYSTGAYWSPYSLAVADFNNDTYLDIVVANYGFDNVGILLGYDNGSFRNQATYPTGSLPCSVAVGDFDNDAYLTLLLLTMTTTLCSYSSNIIVVCSLIWYLFNWSLDHTHSRLLLATSTMIGSLILLSQTMAQIVYRSICKLVSFVRQKVYFSLLSMSVLEYSFNCCNHS